MKLDHGLVPACGGLERPFTVSGRRWLYCWHKEHGHCYLDLDRNVPVWNQKFHPAFSPEYEDVVDLRRLAAPVADGFF